MKARAWIIADVVWPLAAFLGVLWTAWGNWLVITAFAVLNGVLVWICVSEDLRELRREQRWQKWINDNTRKRI